MNTSKYNANESHIFICSNCGYEFSYRLPKIVIDSMNEVFIQTIKKNVLNVISMLKLDVKNKV